MKTQKDIVDRYEEWTRLLQADAMARRNHRISELRSPDDVKAWTEELKQWYRSEVGPLVEMSSEPRSELCGVIERDGYRVEKWLFEVMDGTFSSANLYVPSEVNAEGVAILAPIGHWMDGKAYPDYQNLGAYMAIHGVTVLVYEHPGLGERKEYWNTVRSDSRVGPTPTSEHNRTGDLCTLAGIQPIRFYLTELARAREFLASRDGVQADKIGVSGVSGGGTLTRFAAGYFGDWAFAIPVCIVRGEVIGGSSDSEQCCWNSGIQGVSNVDLLAVMAPRPTMLVTETAFDATNQSYRTLRKIYEIARADENTTELFSIDDVHGYTHPMIEAVYRFMRRFHDLSEPDLDVWNRIRNLSERETWITRDGILHRERPQVKLAGQIKRTVEKVGELTDKSLRELLCISDLETSPIPYLVNGRLGDEVQVTGSCVATKGQLGLLDWCEPHQGVYYQGDQWLYVNKSSLACRFLLHYDRSLIGLRVRQILDFLSDYDGKINCLHADRRWSLPLAIATALAGSDSIVQAKVDSLPLRFADFLDADLNTTGLEQIIPGLLRFGDMDDIIGLAGSRLEVGCRTDADGCVVG